MNHLGEAEALNIQKQIESHPAWPMKQKYARIILGFAESGDNDMAKWALLSSPRLDPAIQAGTNVKESVIRAAQRSDWLFLEGWRRKGDVI